MVDIIKLCVEKGHDNKSLPKENFGKYYKNFVLYFLQRRFDLETRVVAGRVFVSKSCKSRVNFLTRE